MYENMTIEALAQEMKSVREALDDMKKSAATLQQKWDHLRKVAIPDKLEEMGLESCRVAGVGNISVRTDAYCTVPASKKPELYQWLSEHDQEALITATVNASTLKAWMKEQIMEGNDVPPDDIVNFNPYTYVVITK